MDWGGEWAPYVPVAERRRQGTAKAKKRLRKGESLSPVTISGLTIAKTFWGKGWCNHFEKLRDYANRLPRGRTYARNGSVAHLRIDSGKITAFVCGSDLYEVTVKIETLSPAHWDSLCRKCSHSIRNIIDLMRGKLPEAVIQTLTDEKTGMFPRPGEISLRCNCPDGAMLCKHLAAVLYGVGNRLDDAPELLFLLRGVEQADLIGESLRSDQFETADLSGSKLDGEDLGDIFGIDLVTTASPGAGRKRIAPKKKAAKKVATKKKSAPKKRAAKKKVSKKKMSKKKAATKKQSSPQIAKKKRKKPARKPASK